MPEHYCADHLMDIYSEIEPYSVIKIAFLLLGALFQAIEPEITYLIKYLPHA